MSVRSFVRFVISTSSSVPKNNANKLTPSFSSLKSLSSTTTSFSSSSSSSSSSSLSRSTPIAQKRFFSTETKNNTNENASDKHKSEHQNANGTKTNENDNGKDATKENGDPNVKNGENNTNNNNANENNNNEQKTETTSPSPLEEATLKILRLEGELGRIKESYFQVASEIENTRRIAKRDVTDAKVYGIQSFAKSMFEVGDNLSLALEAVPKDQIESNPALKSLFEGVEMTEKGFLKVLGEHGITRYSPLGEKFNPYHHQALFEVVDSTKETGTIANVLKDGYLLKDRVLRPASVGVYKGNIPQQKSQTPP